jgi:hypothetical protein
MQARQKLKAELERNIKASLLTEEEYEQDGFGDGEDELEDEPFISQKTTEVEKKCKIETKKIVREKA